MDMRLVGGVAASVLIASGASAVVVPFTESFNAGDAGWRDASSQPVTWGATAGPDASGAISTAYSFAPNAANDTPILFRAQSGFTPPSSGTALYGDWTAAGVTSVSVQVRHDAPTPLTFFSRYTPGAAPGAIVLAFAPVQPNTWTTLTFPIDAASPALVLEGVSFASVFSNVQRVQFGVSVPAALAGTAPAYTFQIDNVRLIPAPGAAALLGVGAFAIRRRR
jgi:hypothetical protein